MEPNALEQAPPPPYTPATVSDADDFLARCVRAIRGRDIATASRSAALETEMSRIRNLFLFTLSCDYQINPGFSLSAPDRHHFINLCNMLRTLDATFDEARPQNAERQNLAPYFWKYLYEPCRELAIPVEVVLICIDRLIKFVDYWGRYKGCCFGVLQTYGLDALARKLEFDADTVVPAVIEPGPERVRMLQAISEVECLYFHKIHGFESSTMAASGPEFLRRWNERQNISYEANERGRKYNELWKEGTTASTLSLSMRHLTDVAQQCVGDIGERWRRVRAGVQEKDETTTWQGDGFPLPSDGSQRQMPKAWIGRPSIYVPDWFEARAWKGMSHA